MTLIDIMGDLAVVRRDLGGQVGNDVPVVLLMPNGERFEVQSGGYSVGGHTSFLNDHGRYDTRAHAVLTIRQASLPGAHKNPTDPTTSTEEALGHE